MVFFDIYSFIFLNRPCLGDTRANEFMVLTTQHIIWVREHNRIEEILFQLNPHWDGERLFQESRRIIIGMWQHMVYKEYLPVLFGPVVMKQLELEVQDTGFWNGQLLREYNNLKEKIFTSC